MHKTMANAVSILIAIAALAAWSPATGADDSYILIGGGPSPDDSQVSIEQNVLWIDSVLQQAPFSHSRVLFGGGNNGVLDVIFHSDDGPEVDRWMPLARLFGKQEEARIQYRSNLVARNEGSATKERVVELLNTEINKLNAGDSLLLIYSGHGSHNPKDVTLNALRLWGESRLDVKEFTRILNKAPVDTTIRYVLPQCFAGAFARSILRAPSKPGTEGVVTSRCGFFAVDEHNGAEGCTA